MELNHAFVCPRSRAPLSRSGDAFVGPGGERYPVKDGVPYFLALPPREDPGTVAMLERMTGRAREIGWRQALQESGNDVGYVTSEQRARYVDLLPLGPTTRVLEVGASLGQGTAALARRAGSVDAVEVVPGQAAFAAERLRQDGHTNVTLCAAGDDCLLPFPSGRFDVAVLNLVVEWCAQRGHVTAAQAQRRLLSEVSRTVRPGGLVFVATKNRFGVQYLTGGPDEHASNVPFGNALPRWLLDLALRAVRRPGLERGLLHSHAELRRMLVDAGLHTIRSYWAAPDARYPVAYIPVEPDAVRAARATLRPEHLGASRRVRTLMRIMPARLVKHVAPSLVFTGVRLGQAA
jgi:SAM-dependent methyltransferase